MYKSRRPKGLKSNARTCTVNKYKNEFCPASQIYAEEQSEVCSETTLKKEVMQNNNMDDPFDFDNDDFTDLLTVEECQRLENEAWKKAELLEKKSGVEKKKTITCVDLSNDPTRERQTLPKQQVTDKVNNLSQPLEDPQIQHLETHRYNILKSTS